jgi:hypothetical protein
MYIDIQFYLQVALLLSGSVFPTCYISVASLFSDAQAERVGNPEKNVKTVKEPIKTKMRAMKLSQRSSHIFIAVLFFSC